MTSEYRVAPESPFALLSDSEIRAWYAYLKVQLRLRYEMNRQLRHGPRHLARRLRRARSP